MKRILVELSACALLASGMGCAGADGEYGEGEPADSIAVQESAQALVDGASCQEFWDGNNFEVNADLPSNVIITGVGARTNSNEDITTIRLQGRNSNGSGVLGVPQTFLFGPEPNQTPEVWCPVPSGHLAIGVSVSANGNHAVSQIIVHSRQYNAGTRTLQGGTHNSHCGPEANVVPERRVVAWEHTADFDGNVDNVVMTGISLGQRGSAINGLRARFCRLQ